jgi:hypothetical protein
MSQSCREESELHIEKERQFQTNVHIAIKKGKHVEQPLSAGRKENAHR